MHNLPYVSTTTKANYIIYIWEKGLQWVFFFFLVLRENIQAKSLASQLVLTGLLLPQLSNYHRKIKGKTYIQFITLSWSGSPAKI